MGITQHLETNRWHVTYALLYFWQHKWKLRCWRQGVVALKVGHRFLCNKVHTALNTASPNNTVQTVERQSGGTTDQDGCCSRKGISVHSRIYRRWGGEAQSVEYYRLTQFCWAGECAPGCKRVFLVVMFPFLPFSSLSIFHSIPFHPFHSVHFHSFVDIILWSFSMRQCCFRRLAVDLSYRQNLFVTNLTWKSALAWAVRRSLKHTNNAILVIQVRITVQAQIYQVAILHIHCLPLTFQWISTTNSNWHSCVGKCGQFDGFTSRQLTASK